MAVPAWAGCPHHTPTPAHTHSHRTPVDGPHPCERCGRPISSRACGDLPPSEERLVPLRQHEFDDEQFAVIGDRTTTTRRSVRMRSAITLEPVQPRSPSRSESSHPAVCVTTARPQLRRRSVPSIRRCSRWRGRQRLSVSSPHMPGLEQGEWSISTSLGFPPSRWRRKLTHALLFVTSDST